MAADRSLSRRDFLRLRTTDRGRVLELSCRALYMRCADAAATVSDPVDYDTLVGEPPPVLTRRSVEEIIGSIDTELKDVQTVRLIEPDWLDNMPGHDRLRDALDAFTRRGGRIERDTS